MWTIVWIVFLASAIWHGVEPIYYVAFSIGALWVLASGSTVALYNRYVRSDFVTYPFAIVLTTKVFFFHSDSALRSRNSLK